MRENPCDRISPFCLFCLFLVQPWLSWNFLLDQADFKLRSTWLYLPVLWLKVYATTAGQNHLLLGVLFDLCCIGYLISNAWTSGLIQMEAFGFRTLKNIVLTMPNSLLHLSSHKTVHSFHYQLKSAKSAVIFKSDMGGDGKGDSGGTFLSPGVCVVKLHVSSI